LPITLAPLNANSYQASPGDDGWQRFTQLVAAVNAGNLPAAQKAYDGFANSTAADLAKANPGSRLTQALVQIGEALQGGDVGRAQQALTTLRSRAQTNRDEGTPALTVASPKTAPSDQSGPGATFDVVV
jgi:hypothetical protein